MANVPNLPPEFQHLQGVEFNPPPAEHLVKTEGMIRDAVSQLGKDEKFMLTWIVTDKGVNTAAVRKLGDHVEVMAWIGKSWGDPISVGVAGAWHF